MLRLLFRLLGLLSLAGAFAAAVLDGARSLADQGLQVTPIGETLARLAPAKFAALHAAAAKIHPKLWDPVLVWVLYTPTLLVLAVVGVALIAATRAHGEPSPIGERR